MIFLLGGPLAVFIVPAVRREIIRFTQSHFSLITLDHNILHLILALNVQESRFRNYIVLAFKDALYIVLRGNIVSLTVTLQYIAHIIQDCESFSSGNLCINRNE